MWTGSAGTIHSAAAKAGVINLTMLVVAASLFHATGNTGIDTIEGAHAGFERLIGGGAALAFAVGRFALPMAQGEIARKSRSPNV